MDVDFDFYSKFKDYTTVALLKISKRPAGYRAEAIRAINQLLDERAISQQEIDEAEAELHALDNKAKNKRHRANTYEDNTDDFLEPVTHPGAERNLAKWLNVLLVVIGIQYLGLLYNVIKDQIRLLQCDDCHFTTFYYLVVVAQIYTPIVGYLVLKRNRWGWALLFAGVLNSLIAAIIPFVYQFAYKIPFQGVSATFIMFQLIKVGLCYFLCRNNMLDYFGIARKEKEKAILTAFLIAALLSIMPGYPVLPIITRFW
jgi:hypothetical protein